MQFCHPPSTLFSPQAHHKHFLRDVLLDCAFMTDLISSSVNHIPITIATGNSISSFAGFFELLHYIPIESRTYFVGQDSQCFPFEIHICWKSLREYKKGSTFLSTEQRSLGRRFGLELHSALGPDMKAKKNSTAEEVMTTTKIQNNSPRRIDRIRLQEERG